MFVTLKGAMMLFATFFGFWFAVWFLQKKTHSAISCRFQLNLEKGVSPKAMDLQVHFLQPN